MTADVIIIGQGLAGSSLALTLGQDLKIVVVDDGHRSAASLVAAGMWNPVAFRNLHLAWGIPEVLAQSREFYHRTEQLFGCKLIHDLELVRIFPDTISGNQWAERSDNPGLASFITDQEDSCTKNSLIQPHGHGVLRGAGWVDLPLFLSRTREWVAQNQTLIADAFDPDEVQFTPGGVIYRGIQAQRLVIAVGSRNHGIPWFSTVPIRPNKGQVLKVRIPGLRDLKRIVNFSQFVLPLNNSEFRLGATYEFADPDAGPTEAGRKKLLDALSAVFPGEVEVLEHLAGYRPTVPDRRPVIGQHPELPGLYLFNGFGSKGVILAPWSAEKLRDHLISGTALPPEISLSRYL